MRNVTLRRVTRFLPFRYVRRNSEPCLPSQVKNCPFLLLLATVYCSYRAFAAAAVECTLASDTTLRCSVCSRVPTCGSSETVYLRALPSTVRSFCVTRTDGIRSVLKIFTCSQNSSYQILGFCMQWTTTVDRVCDTHFAKHSRESLSAISTSILMAV
jgi:hypothetical protein